MKSEKHINKIHKRSIYFKQPQGLHIICIIIFCLGLCVYPLIIEAVNQKKISHLFLSYNNYIFVMCFASIFGCISNYLFGAKKSIIHGLQFIIIALIISFVRNVDLLSLALLWTGLSIVIINLFFNLSSFYLKTDVRRLYGYIAVCSSAILGANLSIPVYLYISQNSEYLPKILYLFIVILILIFFLKNSYRLNTSLTEQTQRIDVSFYNIFIMFFIFSLALLYLFLHIKVFSVLIILILPISTVYLHILTKINNKEKGSQLLKFIYLYIIIGTVNECFLILAFKYQKNINLSYFNSTTSTFILGLISYAIYLGIYLSWKLKLFTINIESIINSSLIKILIFLEFIKILVLIISIYISVQIFINIMFLILIILAIIINSIMTPVLLSLGKILAGGKNEMITTILLYLLFLSLIFASSLVQLL